MSGNKIVRKLKNEIRNETVSDSDQELEEKPKKAMEATGYKNDMDIEFDRVRRKRRGGRRRSKSRRRRSRSRRRH
ncbi:hypothetical protein DOY81_003062 [Sarcophaga bullata]|nr:hypothetical protein DOY81_003062 [Sarcophaga bullata]